LPVISLVKDMVNIIWGEMHFVIESDGLRLTQYYEGQLILKIGKQQIWELFQRITGQTETVRPYLDKAGQTGTVRP
jgi:hypothetical protein